MLTLAFPKEVEHWSLTTLRGLSGNADQGWSRSVRMWSTMAGTSHSNWPRWQYRETRSGVGRGTPLRGKTTGGVCLDDDNIERMGFRTPPNHKDQAVGCQRRKTFQRQCNLGMVGADLEVVWEMSVNRECELSPNEIPKIGRHRPARRRIPAFLRELDFRGITGLGSHRKPSHVTVRRCQF